jgi:hypothetical protein
MIKVELIGKREAIDVWGSRPVNAAMKSTLARIAKSAMSTASAEVRAVYNIKKSDLDPRMNMVMQGSENAAIIISGKGTSLSYFGAKQFTVNKTITRGKKDADGKASLSIKTRKRSHVFQGVEVEVIKGKKTQLRSAFMARMKSGHIGVMHRWSNAFMKKKTKTGKPIHAIGEKGVVSLVTMIKNINVQPVVLAKVQADWKKVFAQQLAYQVEKAGGKSKTFDGSFPG